MGCTIYLTFEMTFRILRQQCGQTQHIISTCTKTRVCYNIMTRHYLSTVAKATKTITHLPQVFTPLQKHAPTFYARGDDIIPLYEPHAFYSELKVTIKLSFFFFDTEKI